jgi:hypothetical protein
MTEYRRRDGDPENFDPRTVRQIRPAEWDLQLGWGNKTLSVKGLAIIAVLAVALVVGATMYAAFQQGGQHVELGRGQDQLSCILTMGPEERVAFRKDVGPNAFERWCWWVRAQR